MTKSRSREDSKSRRDVPKKSREVDTVGERDNKVYLEGQNVIRREKRLSREINDRFRPEELDEAHFEGRRDRQVIREEDRKHRDIRRHGKDSSHNWKMGNGSKFHQHDEDSLTKLSAGRRSQFHRSFTTINKRRSRKGRNCKGNVEDQVHSVPNIHKQSAKGIGYGSDEWHGQDDQDDEDDHRHAHKSGSRVDHDNNLPCRRVEHDNIWPKSQPRKDKTGTTERFARQPGDIGNGPALVRQNSEDRKAAKENVDDPSRRTRGKDQSGSMDVIVPRPEVALQISKAVGGSSRSCDSKVVASSQSAEQGVTDQNGEKVQRACIEAKHLESRSQKNGSLDNISKLPDLEAVKSFGQEEPGGNVEWLRQGVLEVHCGPEAASKDMLHQSMSDSSVPGGRKREYRVGLSEGHEKLRVESAHKRERLIVKEGQEFKSILDEKSKDWVKSEGAAKKVSSSTETDIQEGMRKDSRTRKKSQHLKREKFSMQKKEKSNESLLRRHAVDVDRHKHDASSQEHKRQRRRGRSHSVSPNKHKDFFSPKAHGKSTSPGRSERSKSDWEKFERERRKSLAAFDSRYRRFGGGTSGLGGYSPRRRRSEAAVKTPSPPPRSPERKKEKAWDSAPPGMDSSMIAAISAAHQAAMQHALVTLATVNPLVPNNMLISSSGTPAVANRFIAVPSMHPSLQPQINPAVTAVTLTQATRPLRRLYVGNVPSTVSDGELLEFLNAAMLSANANHLPGTKPCINCSVNVEKNHAFAEFITPEDATAALAFDGVTLHGTTLKIRRPKDYVRSSNGGNESVSAVPDMVSSSVADSPHKGCHRAFPNPASIAVLVFVGGIPSSLTSDKVKEIVTAFGQLKAYHWEVDQKKQPPQSFAFFEYMDPTATVAACAGLNGMRLGSGFLTVVRATPDADTKSAGIKAPFYGIPEHAKSLLEAPSRVLELHNLVTAEAVPHMSKEDIEELIEDVRLECTRFGDVKSTHIVHRRAYSDLETGNTPSLGTNKGAAAENSRGANLDCTSVPQSTQENNIQEGTHVGLTGGQNEPREEMSSDPARLQLDTSTAVDEKQMLAMDPADGFSSGQLCEGTRKSNEENSCHTNESSANLQIILGELSSECQASTSASQMDKIMPSDGKELVQVQDQDIGGLTSGSQQEVDVSMREWETSHLGKVYVEFSGEESACQAAHALHGRLFDGHKVAVCYFPLKSFQKWFHKGLGPRTFQEKQSLELAVQEHLTADIKD